MPGTGLSRRALLGYAPALTFAATAAPSLLKGTVAEAQTSPLASGVATLSDSIARAFDFQNFMMDAYATGSTVRLIQSYSDEALGATAFTYDNAVAIQAYLASGDAALQERAIILGDGLLYGQANPYPFPISDGRFPQAFYVNVPSANGTYVTPAAAPFYFYGSSVGDQAWAGMALAQLYARTNSSRFLTGALTVANWIVQNTYDTLGAGGYRFGAVILYDAPTYTNYSAPSPNGKSTEHNIDTYAFFMMLSKLTGDAKATAINMKWSELAQHALTFVEAMYNADGRFFWTGTLGDQVSINYYPVPEDVQTWSYLALLKKKYQGSIDWALANLEATDTASQPHSSLTGNQTIHGLVFDSASLNTTQYDPQAVWLEGTGHMISALATRVLAGSGHLQTLLHDLKTADALLQQSMRAQLLLGYGKTVGGKLIPKGTGLVAATSVMDTGFGYTYGPSLHVGATGWFLLGAQAANPFQLNYRIVG